MNIHTTSAFSLLTQVHLKKGKRLNELMHTDEKRIITISLSSKRKVLLPLTSSQLAKLLTVRNLLPKCRYWDKNLNHFCSAVCAIRMSFLRSWVAFEHCHLTEEKPRCELVSILPLCGKSSVNQLVFIRAQWNLADVLEFIHWQVIWKRHHVDCRR